MPTELELIALETEFELYLPFSKRLVLNLPDSRDRARAAQWLLKLRSITDDNFKKLRNEHLKLLLFALHRRAMVGLFEKFPPKDELESFHDGLTLLEMTRELIEITEKKAQQSGGNKDLKPGECPLPKVYANFSCDLKEYTASQNIPKFGAHVFYAISSQPIQFWTKSGNSDYPAMGDIPNAMQWEQILRKLSDHVLEKQDEMDKKIALQKAIEAGDASADDLDPAIDFSKKIRVQTCPTDQFKWKKDSLLRVYQNYDFSNVKDLKSNGKGDSGKYYHLKSRKEHDSTFVAATRRNNTLLMSGDKVQKDLGVKTTSDMVGDLIKREQKEKKEKCEKRQKPYRDLNDQFNLFRRDVLNSVDDMLMSLVGSRRNSYLSVYNSIDHYEFNSESELFRSAEMQPSFSSSEESASVTNFERVPTEELNGSTRQIQQPRNDWLDRLYALLLELFSKKGL